LVRLDPQFDTIRARWTPWSSSRWRAAGRAVPGTGKSAAARQRPATACGRRSTSKEISHRLGCHSLSDSARVVAALSDAGRDQSGNHVLTIGPTLARHLLDEIQPATEGGTTGRSR
jgi:hypothetical protein